MIERHIAEPVRVMKHVLYRDGLSKKWRVIVTFNSGIAFDTEEEAEAWVRQFEERTDDQ